jgi:hypothetical protein
MIPLTVAACLPAAWRARRVTGPVLIGAGLPPVTARARGAKWADNGRTGSGVADRSTRRNREAGVDGGLGALVATGAPVGAWRSRTDGAVGGAGCAPARFPPWRMAVPALLANAKVRLAAGHPAVAACAPTIQLPRWAPAGGDAAVNAPALVDVPPGFSRWLLVAMAL